MCHAMTCVESETPCKRAVMPNAKTWTSCDASQVLHTHILALEELYVAQSKEIQDVHTQCDAMTMEWDMLHAERDVLRRSKKLFGARMEHAALASPETLQTKQALLRRERMALVGDPRTVRDG
jgi:hypothetical protein